MRAMATGAVALSFMVCSLASVRPTNASMYYPWAGQFPWDQPASVNPDVISDWLLSTSTHWPALSDYGLYRPTFAPGRNACLRGMCRSSELKHRSSK